METRYLLFVGGPNDGKVFAVLDVPYLKLPRFRGYDYGHPDDPMKQLFDEAVYRLRSLWGIQFYAFDELGDQDTAKLLLSHYRPVLG